jgi:hypothetical protein
MQKHIKKTLTGILLIPLLFTSVAVAHNGDDHGQTEPSKPSVAATVNETTREERIEARKEKLERRLSQVQQNIVKTRCSVVKGVVNASQARIKSFEAKRTQVYSRLVVRLEELGPKLQAAGADTTTYDSQVAELKTMVESYETEIAALTQAVTDLKDMDCEADPEGFVATIQAAAERRQTVIEKGREIRTYLKETLRPTFTDIRAQLAKDDTEDQEGDDTEQQAAEEQ